MDSTTFFNNKEFNGRWKEKKNKLPVSGVYVIECPLFTQHIGYPVYKVGFAKNSLYTRISNYRTCYGLVPFKIHLLYHIPQKVINKRVNYAHLNERVAQHTIKDCGEWTGVGEWFKNKDLIIDVFYKIRERHLREIPTSGEWEFWVAQPIKDQQKIELPKDLRNETEISGLYKDLIAGRHTRSGDNEDPEEDYQFEEINRSSQPVRQQPSRQVKNHNQNNNQQEQ